MAKKEFSTQVVGTGFYLKVADIIFAAGGNEGAETLETAVIRRGLIRLFSERFGWECEEANAFLREAGLPETDADEFDTLSAHPAAPIKKGERIPKAENAPAEKPARQRMTV